MSKKYLVKLTPHDKFFFGGENTFGVGKQRNYFVKSNYFPQQTTLLGLVRYQLMVQNKNGIFNDGKIQKPKDASDLINHKSFDINDTEFSFGKIQELSPVFIANEKNEFLFPANKEYQWIDKDEDEKEINDFVFREFNKVDGESSFSKKFIPCLEKYNPKLDLPDLLVNKNLSLMKYYDYDKDKELKKDPHNGIFVEYQQTGIRKNYKGITEDNAYYVQTFYKLDKGYSFAFILELDDSIKIESQNVVILGGEQSKFKMDVTYAPDKFKNLLPNYEQSKNSDKVVLVSDAYVSNEIFNNCSFAVTDTVDFRSIKSSVNTTNYAGMDLKGIKTDVLSKSSKYNFFKKGSVFYGENISKITSHLDVKNAIKKIGYNHYKIVDKEGSKL